MPSSSSRARSSSVSTPLAPSEHSMIRSPACTSTRNRSGSVSLDPVDGAQDQVPVRMHARLGLGDPALVDQALHERVVLGELGELATPHQVSPAVADVADPQPGAVEDRGRDRGAGAVELGVLLDQAGDPSVGRVDRLGERARAGRRRGVRRARAAPRRPRCWPRRLARTRRRRRPPRASTGRRTRSPGCPCGPGRRRRRRCSAAGSARRPARSRRPRPGARPGARPVARLARRRARVLLTGYFRSSRIVLPIRTWLPRVSVVGCTIRVLPT